MNKLYITIIAACSALILLASALFTVDQRQTAVIFQFASGYINSIEHNREHLRRSADGIRIGVPYVSEHCSIISYH